MTNVLARNDIISGTLGRGRAEGVGQYIFLSTLFMKMYSIPFTALFVLKQLLRIDRVKRKESNTRKYIQIKKPFVQTAICCQQAYNHPHIHTNWQLVLYISN